MSREIDPRDCENGWADTEDLYRKDSLISDIAVWPDGTWAYIAAISCYTWKSDDFARVTFDELRQGPDQAAQNYLDNLRYV